MAEHDPAPGTPAPLRSTVMIIAWAGLSPVPDVVGKSADDARATLSPGGRAGSFAVLFDPAQTVRNPPKAGLVAAQKPAAGEMALRGGTNTLTVYKYQSH